MDQNVDSRSKKRFEASNVIPSTVDHAQQGNGIKWFNNKLLVLSNIVDLDAVTNVDIERVTSV